MIAVRRRSRNFRAALVTLLVAAWVAVPSESNVSAGVDPVPHPGIFIDGDLDFRLGPLVGVRNPAAAGTRADPFAIEGWDIGAPGPVRSLRPPGSGGIHIQNTTAHFVVSANVVHDHPGVGIFLRNVRNGTLQGNVLRANTTGVHIGSSRLNTARSNVVDSNGVGLTLPSSSGNLVYNNRFANAKNLEDPGDGNLFNVEKTPALGPNIVGEALWGGNFWSDYHPTDRDCDFLGDHPYGPDNLPLVRRGPRLEVDPPEALVIPEERLELTVERVEADCVTRRKLASDEITFTVGGSSNAVTRDGTKTRIDVFGAGDVDARGTTNVSAGGMSFPMPYRLVAPGADDAALVDRMNADLAGEISSYNDSRIALGGARRNLETEAGQLDRGTARTVTPSTVFNFRVTWDQLRSETPVVVSPHNVFDGLLFVERPSTLKDAYFELVGGTLTLHASRSPVYVNTGGGISPCPADQKCYTIKYSASLRPQHPFREGAVERTFHEHRSFGGQSITALSTSWIAQDGRARTAYLTQPPTTWGATQITGTDDRTVRMNTIASSGDTWNFEATTFPYQEFNLRFITDGFFRLFAYEYANLGQAEAAAQAAYANMLRRQADLAARKVKAIADLKAASAELASSTGPMRKTWEDYAKGMSEGLGEFVEEVNKNIQNDDEIAQELKDEVSELAGKFDKGRAVFDLFVLMSRADNPGLSDFDRLRAVKEAFDIARRLGPGGELVKLLNPFFEFYSQALGAAADALEKIDDMRKEQVLSTGECSIIRSIIADPQRQKAWEDACKLRQLLQRVRDP